MGQALSPLNQKDGNSVESPVSKDYTCCWVFAGIFDASLDASNRKLSSEITLLQLVFAEMIARSKERAPLVTVRRVGPTGSCEASEQFSW